jgi:hypothetical protein
MGIFDHIVHESDQDILEDAVVEDASREKSLAELLAISRQREGQTGYTPDLEASRVPGAVVEELKMGVRDRLIGFGLIDQLAEDRAREHRKARLEDIKKLQQKTGQSKRINRDEERVKYRSAAEDILAVAASDALAADPDFEVSSGWIEDQIRSLTQVGQQIATTTFGGPVAGIADMALMITGATYSGLERKIPEIAAKLQKADPNLSEADAMVQAQKRVRTASFASAIVQSPMEYLGIKKLSKLIKPQKNGLKFLKDISEVVGVEGLTEYLQSIGPEAVAELWALNPNEDVMKLWGEELNKWETHKRAFKGAGHAMVSSFIFGAAGSHKRVKREIREEAVANEAAKELEAAALEEEAAKELSPHEEARLARKIAKAESRKEKPVEKSKPKKAKPTEESKPDTEEKPKETGSVKESFADLAAKANKLSGKQEEQGTDKIHDIIATKEEVAEVEAALADVKAKVAEAEKLGEPDVPVEKLPKKGVKEPSMKDLDEKEDRETPPAEDVEDTATKELGLDIEPEVKKPEPKPIPGFGKMPQMARLTADGKLEDITDIPTVAGKGKHTEDERNQISQTVRKLNATGEGEVVFVDKDGNPHSLEDVAGMKVGTQAELEDVSIDPETGEEVVGAGAAFRAKQGQQAKEVRERKEAKTTKKLIEEAKAAKPLNKKQEAEFKRLMTKVRGAARRMSKANNADYGDLVSE